MASPLVGDSVVALEKTLCGSTFEPCTESTVMAHQVDTYGGLLQQIHNDLRIQHPEWIQPNGESPMCDSYEGRLLELLDTSTRKRSNKTTGVSTGILECGRSQNRNRGKSELKRLVRPHKE
ncbi:MAG: hypothetical protein DMF36_04800 [Verrucomicrobia bacterium]|nr:MAG: hypothetical protein AUH08_11095 [Verrucomicrobia bacterium 13_2_20CM_54_12]OLB43398.1 MAG: hypothetical protein AUI00_03865 [Verrucomicrobia bacterium 13_2_20CM_2_54_15]OLD89127.1 MAG: hypothetical protein AUG81_05170 [Verrucomicrobia bacterium 13_1_20CM_4_54_11]OLE10525.1 MAG: hypothetical protein AUG52_09400 [Verrucomicrobia bacterium 13_1_20CM_3_54_17]PYL39657.1 MAG: hypothetical protein DMF36_04800 [Verrucomicrobiota bacterium]